MYVPQTPVRETALPGRRRQAEGERCQSRTPIFSSTPGYRWPVSNSLRIFCDSPLDVQGLTCPVRSLQAGVIQSIQESLDPTGDHEGPGMHDVAHFLCLLLGQSNTVAPVSYNSTNRTWKLPGSFVGNWQLLSKFSEPVFSVISIS